MRDKHCFFKPEELTHEMLIASLEAEAHLKKEQRGKKNLGFACQ